MFLSWSLLAKKIFLNTNNLLKVTQNFRNPSRSLHHWWCLLLFILMRLQNCSINWGKSHCCFLLFVCVCVFFFCFCMARRVSFFNRPVTLATKAEGNKRKRNKKYIFWGKLWFIIFFIRCNKLVQYQWRWYATLWENAMSEQWSVYPRWR